MEGKVITEDMEAKFASEDKVDNDEAEPDVVWNLDGHSFLDN